MTTGLGRKNQEITGATITSISDTEDGRMISYVQSQGLLDTLLGNQARQGSALFRYSPPQDERGYPGITDTFLKKVQPGYKINLTLDYGAVTSATITNASDPNDSMDFWHPARVPQV